MMKGLILFRYAGINSSNTYFLDTDGFTRVFSTVRNVTYNMRHLL